MKMVSDRKRALSLLLSAALLLAALPACRGPAGESSPPDALDEMPTALDVVNAVFPSCGFDGSADVEYLTTEEGRGYLSAYIENAYGLEEGAWEDAAVIRATGASAFELAVLRLGDEGAAVRAASNLMGYISARQGDFTGYAPDQADMAANGSINQSGPYAALFICPDTDLADRAFGAAVHGGALPSQPGDDTPELAAEAGAILDYLMGQCRDEVDALDGGERLDDGSPDALANYIEGAYGLARGQWEGAAIFRGTGVSAFELAVLGVEDEDAAWSVMEMLSGYLDRREGDFAGYAPDQADLLYRASAYSLTGGSFGTFVILPVCKDAQEVVETLVAALRPDYIGQEGRHEDPARPETDPSYPDRCAFTPPNKDDMSLYDTSAIRAAWAADDPSGLSGYDKKIYDAAQKVLGRVLEDGMGDLEKETAIYSWVVNNVDYDWTHQNIMAVTPRESFTPYGGLVNRTAVCLGYAATFQLLCDLAGVECITVVGAAFQSTGDHGWNMVRLDGEWYCVDVTWDANYREQGATRGRERDWNYFNVTSDDMAASDHQWDYANTPEATAGDHGRG